jgi:hypothetical protein
MAAHPAAADVLACQEVAMLLVMVQSHPWDFEVPAASPLALRCWLLLMPCC